MEVDWVKTEDRVRLKKMAWCGDPWWEKRRKKTSLYLSYFLFDMSWALLQNYRLFLTVHVAPQLSFCRNLQTVRKPAVLPPDSQKSSCVPPCMSKAAWSFCPNILIYLWAESSTEDKAKTDNVCLCSAVWEEWVQLTNQDFMGSWLYVLGLFNLLIQPMYGDIRV